MLYLINDKYYMLRNREYVKVDIELKAKGVLVDTIIKELRNKESSHNRDNTRKNKYDM